jgi:hypothetical protein
VCVPTILRFASEGKLPLVDRSLAEIERFAAQHDFRKIVIAAILQQQIGATARIAFSDLLHRLSSIWNYKGFPFFCI